MVKILDENAGSKHGVKNVALNVDTKVLKHQIKNAASKMLGQQH